MKDRVFTGILIGIDTSLKEPYISITKDGPLSTWLLSKDSDVQTVIYYSKKPDQFLIWLNNMIEKWRWKGGSPKAYFVSASLFLFLLPFRNFLPSFSPGNFFDTDVKQLQVNLPEVLFMQRWKKIAILSYFLEHTSNEYLLFVTPSCYINKSRLKEIVSALPKKRRHYSGSIQKNHDGPFIAGGTLLLNRESANDILTGRSSIPTHTMDDVGLGILVRRLGIELTQLPGLITDSIDVEDFPRAKENFYVRFKSAVNEERKDAALMQKFHEVMQHD